MLYHDNETNKVFFSSWLSSSKYFKFKLELEKLLNNRNISYEYITDSKDIWLRDFMPIQRNDNKLVFYDYKPDYLKDKLAYQTDSNKLECFTKFSYEKIDIPLIIDGGNIVRARNKIVLTDKIFKENESFSKNEIIRLLQKCLKVEDVIIIPQQPSDWTGHSDGMVRFIDEETVLVNDFSLESDKFNENLLGCLKNYNLEVHSLKYSDYFFTKKRNWGAYLNYMQIGKNVIVPSYGIKEDDNMHNLFIDIFHDSVVDMIDSNSIIKDGGALNCISWNIKV